MNNAYFSSLLSSKAYEHYCDTKKTPTGNKTISFPNDHKSESKMKSDQYHKNSNKQNFRNQNNQNLPKQQEKDIISINSSSQGNLRKTIVSKALYGLQLKQATNQENLHSLAERTKQKEKLIEKDLPNAQPIKTSNKPLGTIMFYSAATNMGIVRKYNQDRVSIILNMIKQGKEQLSYFFGVFDGHGGSACSDFLRDNLHQFVVKQSSFPSDPQQALRRGFIQAQKTFLSCCQKTQSVQRSGSCGVVTMIVGQKCYVANVGDSRALLSSNNGKKIYALTRDHKPIDLAQQRRIQEAGGKIFQTLAHYQNVQNQTKQVVGGPLRVYPGRLSVSRTFGDIQAKLPQYGGNIDVIIAQPQITVFKLSQDHDFIVMGSDGIFDKLSNEDVINSCFQNDNKCQNEHQFAKNAVENVLRQAMNRKSLDNVTLVMIGFKRWQKQRGLIKLKNKTQNKLQHTSSRPSLLQKKTSNKQLDKKLPR